MDLTADQTWLGEIAALTKPHSGVGLGRHWPYPRRHAAARSRRPSSSTAGFEPSAISAPPPLAQPSSRLTWSVSPCLGNAVWSTLAVRIAPTTTSSGGVRRAIYHATAAKLVGAGTR